MSLTKTLFFTIRKVTQINTEVEASYTLHGNVWGSFCPKHGQIFVVTFLEIERKGFRCVPHQQLDGKTH